MVYCNAGHPPPLLFQDGQFRRLEIGGLLLGPEPDASYERGFERFLPGSTLLFYTDGIVEAQNRAGKEFGAARLEKLLRQMKGARAADIVDAIFAEAARFATARSATTRRRRRPPSRLTPRPAGAARQRATAWPGPRG